MSDAAAIGGIGIGTMLFDLLYWNFGFLRVGTSGLTAQAYGRWTKDNGQRTKDNGQGTKGMPETTKILLQSLSISGIGALFVWAIQWLFVTAALAIVPCSAEVAGVAREYFFVRIWAAPATLSLMAFKGWFIGMQDTKSPMAVDILVNVVNMGASYGLAVYTPLGVVGVAWGTLIAQYSGLLLAAVLLKVRYSEVSLFRQQEEMKAALRWSEMRRMMSLNGNLFVRSLCFMVVYVGYQALASQYGDTELAVSIILMKLFMFFSYFVDGFAYAGEALVGKAFGERTKDNGQRTMDMGQRTMDKGQRTKDKGQWTKEIRDIVRLLFNWSIGVGLVFTGVYAIWGTECIGIMTDKPYVIDAAQNYLGWLTAMPIVSALAFMWDGVYIGATAGVQIRNAMIWAAAGFVVFYLATYRIVGVQALYVAYFAHLIARVVYLSIKWDKLKVTS